MPPPNAHNQFPVSEAAPGNPDFNGGRWFAQTVEWTNLDLTDTLLTSSDDVLYYYNMGDLSITPGHPDGPTYFECPLRPVH